MTYKDYILMANANEPIKPFDSISTKIDKIIYIISTLDQSDAIDQLTEEVNSLKHDVDVLNDNVDELIGDVAELFNKMPKKEFINIKITPDDWNGSLEYTYLNDALTLDKNVKVSATVDGTVIDGVTVTGNAVYIASFVIEPTAQTSAGQLMFKAQSVPTENVYLTLEIESLGVENEPNV